MDIAIAKGRTGDRISIVRSDGSVAETVFAKKGPVPHDAVHFFVERGFALRQAFWGMVAAGRHPEELADLAKAAGHASAKRAGIPDASIVELLQAERIVECFEADLWGGGADDAALLEIAALACETAHVPMPAVVPTTVSAVRGDLAAFAREWMGAPEGHVARLKWDPA